MTRTIPLSVMPGKEPQSSCTVRAASDTVALLPTSVIPPPIVALPISTQPLAVASRTGKRFTFMPPASSWASLCLHALLLIALALMVVDRKSPESHSIISGITEPSGEFPVFELTSASPEMPQLDSDFFDSEKVEPVASLQPFRIASELSPPSIPVAMNLGEGLDKLSDLGHGLGGRPGNGLNGIGLGNDFREMVEYAKLNGLDLVIVFDSTGSMGHEIAGVKQRITQIGSALLRQLPSMRIGLVTYRDRGPLEGYSVLGLPLTSDLSKLTQFMQPIEADGGGDREEAVELGLKWALTKNSFRPQARKIVLIFGDAPPHKQHMAECIKLARDFRQKKSGIVTTVTVRAMQPLDEFYLIAKAGSGEAYTNRDPMRLMNDLLVLAFGAKHREDVLKFFGLADEFMQRAEPTHKTPFPPRRRNLARP